MGYLYLKSVAYSNFCGILQPELDGRWKDHDKESDRVLVKL